MAALRRQSARAQQSRRLEHRRGVCPSWGRYAGGAKYFSRASTRCLRKAARQTFYHTMVRKRERLSTDPDEGDATRREVGKALERRLDEMRKGAGKQNNVSRTAVVASLSSMLSPFRPGIPTKAEHEAAQANPPPPAERRLLLGASCLVLMAVASRASNTMVRRTMHSRSRYHARCGSQLIPAWGPVE